MTAAQSGDAAALFAAKARPSAALAELLAEEERAWAARREVLTNAENQERAWKAANPDLDARTDLPPAIAALDAEAYRLAEVAGAITDRLQKWVPDSLADAIALLDCEIDSPEQTNNVIAGLRRIASSGNAGAPVAATEGGRDADEAIIKAFRDWVAACDAADAAGDACVGDLNDDPVYVAASDGRYCAIGKLADIGIGNAAIVGALRDAVRFVPELAPLCAEALAAQGRHRRR